MKFSSDFKKAILELPVGEKDKLLLRLLKKDLNLANRLSFELLDERTVDERRNEMERRIVNRVEHISNNFWSPGYLMMDMRYLSGEITDHVRMTKDKFGEISLNLLMLIEVLKRNGTSIGKATPSKRKKIDVYVIARSFKILLLITKLHEDYLMDFEKPLKDLATLIGKDGQLMKTAIHHGLDMNWMAQVDIPENIDEIHKDLRFRGYLK